MSPEVRRKESQDRWAGKGMRCVPENRFRGPSAMTTVRARVRARARARVRARVRACAVTLAAALAV